MPSPGTVANVALIVGLLSPVIAVAMPNVRWWFRVVLIEAAFIGAAIWVIGEAVDAEAAKPRENLDVQLAHAMEFWMVVLGGLLFVASFAARLWFLRRKARGAATSHPDRIL
jgi:hypothetical protein